MYAIRSYYVHIRHHVVQNAVRFAGVVDTEDVGVFELGGERDLAQEPFSAQDSGQVRPQDLQSYNFV